MSKSLYLTLDIHSDATDAEIKTAFRKRASETHPDKTMHNGGEDTTEQYKAVQHAYDVLSDADKRAAYDRGENPSARNFTMAEKIDQRARENLMRMFDMIMSELNEHELSTHDLVQVFRDTTLNGANAVPPVKAQIKTELRKLNKARRRLKTKDFMLVDHIRQRRIAFIRAFKDQQFTQKVGVRMLELVDEMEYRVDPPAAQPQFNFLAFGSGSYGGPAA